ncbi:hypothetical protein E0L21_02000 [Kosakonia quasisacchari]|uniref:Uncharacterized protein n=1 Tax=Kosakonia quasisacchari TaxID=2529380 RepID=A0A4R0HVP1_9ENTR|nr:hypothetical protein E0L21_02000 [Kosakonia quasisacchari]
MEARPHIPRVTDRIQDIFHNADHKLADPFAIALQGALIIYSGNASFYLHYACYRISGKT